MKYFIALLLCVFTFNLAQGQDTAPVIKESSKKKVSLIKPSKTPSDSIINDFSTSLDSLSTTSVLIDSTAIVADTLLQEIQVSSFDPDAMRAVWLSALCPGLGQIYNRRYWKLPIVEGGFTGLIYATTWNSRMFTDYQQAYLDVTDTDPNTKSYMDFFPPYYTEDMIDQAWLKNVLKTRKDAYRHYRDYCIVGMVALYLVCIIDAYVDAEMYHFDISTELAMNVKPALIPTSLTQQPALGLQCAITF
jgi:hypothetical protein